MLFRSVVSDDIRGGKGVVLRADVRNAGAMDGTETVQIYVGLEREDAPNPQLKKIVKVSLKAGETRKVEVVLPREAFMLCNKYGERILYPGTYHIYMGGSQPDARSRELTKKEVCHFQISLD